MLFHLAILDRACRCCFSYYFGPATVVEQVAWEAVLAAEVRPLLDAAFRQDVPLSVGDRTVVLRGIGAGGAAAGGAAGAGAGAAPAAATDVVFVLAGADLDDELALVESMTVLVAVASATCDRRLTAAQVVDFHGKLAVCMEEAAFEGVLTSTDAEAVVRAAKLKPYRG